MRRRRFPLSVFLLLVGAGLAVMAVEALADITGGVELSAADAQRVLASLARSHTQLLSVMFICLAVAVPVTANQYTPKLLRVFLGDRMHVAVLSTYAMAAAHANWALYASRTGAVSQVIVAAVMTTCIVAFILVVPYFFYVIEFLEPHTLVRRIRAQASRALARAVAGEGRRDKSRTDLAHALHDLGSLVLKSLDGMGRESAERGIVAIRDLLEEYGRRKARLDAGWFEATKAEFRGLSREALQFTTAERCWVEVAALRDLGRAFDAAVAGMPDAVVLIADTVRGIGEDANARDDIPVLDNTVRALNSMVRSAINAKNPRAIFDVLLQYEALAEVCLERRPELAGEIATFYAHYGIRARRADLEFIPELFVYDLGALLRSAGERGSAAAPRVLASVHELVEHLAVAPTAPLACALMVILGTCREGLPEDEQARLLDRLLSLPARTVDAGLAVLDRTHSPRYHELSSRQVDVNFLPPQDLEAVTAMIAAARAQLA